MEIGGVLSQYDLGLLQKKSSLEQTLDETTQDATDEKLMDVCKTFESYLVEQVFKQMERTVLKEKEDGEYVSYFKDFLYEDYAKTITEQQDLGIAKMLYESMKKGTS